MDLQYELDYIIDKEAELERIINNSKYELSKLKDIKNKLINENKCDIKIGSFCWFWDFNENGKKIRPMIRPFHHMIFHQEKKCKLYYSADLEGNMIGHGWKYCIPVKLEEFLGRIM